MMGTGEGIRATYGTSVSNKILNYTNADGLKFLYLGDPGQGATVDFQATTIATTAHCIPMTQLCYFNFDGINAGQLFNCTRAFSGNLFSTSLNTSASPNDYVEGSLNVGLAFAGNPELTEAGEQFYVNTTYPGYPSSYESGFNSTKLYTTNPLYYGAWAAGYPAPDLSVDSTAPTFEGDTGIFWDRDRGGRFLLNCSTTVWLVNYTWVNGAVQDFNTTLASTDLAALLSAPLAWVLNQPVANTITDAATVASITGNNSRTIAAMFAQEISRAMLAYSLSAIDPVVNILEQERIAGLKLARIPLVPLYLLIATKAIYVVAVIILAIGAYAFTHPAETEVVKAQLSVRGLAAAHFNSPSMMQQQVIQQIQSRLDAAKEKDSSETKDEEITSSDQSDLPPGQRVLKHAATAPASGTVEPQEPPKNPKVGLLPTADGGWEFVLLANGVWNSIKPIVKSLVVQDANAGGLGEVGSVIKAWN
jgi:hypothetical protein